MVTFRVSIRKEFGDVSVEGNDEDEVITNLVKLQSLEKKVRDALGFDIRIPEDIANKLPELGYIERVLVLLNYSPRPLSRQDCICRTQKLQIPEGWWKGSNFNRDLKAKISAGLVKEIKNGKSKYRLTIEGKKYLKSLLRSQQGN